jgi:DNA-binding MarR family transcriptional regulator
MQPLDAREFERAAVDTVAAAVPGADLDALRASFDLIRASTRLVQRLEAEVHSPAGWSMAGFRVMFCVWVGGELEPRDIARLSGLSRAAVSSVLNTLERDGLVERTRESHDRRLVTVRLTSGRCDPPRRCLRASERRRARVLRVRSAWLIDGCSRAGWPICSTGRERPGEQRFRLRSFHHSSLDYLI